MFEFFRLKKQLSELKTRQDELETQFKSIELEWDETYDKIRTLFARIAKRAERAKGEVLEVHPDATDASEGSTAQFSGLFGRAAEAQKQILARRRRVNGGTQ